MIDLPGLKASRIPVLELPGDARVCYRCGIEWRDSRYHYLDGAPCIDCREILEWDGVDTTVWVRDPYLETAIRGLEARRRRIANLKALEIDDEHEVAA